MDFKCTVVDRSNKLVIKSSWLYTPFQNTILSPGYADDIYLFDLHISAAFNPAPYLQAPNFSM